MVGSNVYEQKLAELTYKFEGESISTQISEEFKHGLDTIITTTNETSTRDHKIP
jgi:hypothetical protein